MIVVVWFQEAFEDIGELGRGGARGCKGLGILLELEEGLFGVGVGLGWTLEVTKVDKEWVRRLVREVTL